MSRFLIIFYLCAIACALTQALDDAEAQVNTESETEKKPENDDKKAVNHDKLTRNIHQQQRCQSHNECTSEDFICSMNTCVPGTRLVGTSCTIDQECEQAQRASSGGCKNGICFAINANLNSQPGIGSQTFENLNGGNHCSNGGYPITKPGSSHPVHCKNHNNLIPTNNGQPNDFLNQRNNQCPPGSICDHRSSICCSNPNSIFENQNSFGNPWQIQSPQGFPWQNQQNFPWQTQNPQGNPWQTQNPQGNPWQSQNQQGNPFQFPNPQNSQWQTQNPQNNPWQSQFPQFQSQFPPISPQFQGQAGLGIGQGPRFSQGPYPNSNPQFGINSQLGFNSNRFPNQNQFLGPYPGGNSNFGNQGFPQNQGFPNQNQGPGRFPGQNQGPFPNQFQLQQFPGRNQLNDNFGPQQSPGSNPGLGNPNAGNPQNPNVSGQGSVSIDENGKK